jgi:hypothetical protein
LRNLLEPENHRAPKSVRQNPDTLKRPQTLMPPTAFSGTASFGFSCDGLSQRADDTAERPEVGL